MDADARIEELGQQTAHLAGLLTGLVRYQPETREEREVDIRRVAAIVVIAEGLLAAARTTKMLLEDSLE